MDASSDQEMIQNTFDTKLVQIEQTDRLLSTLEQKLSLLFSQNQEMEPIFDHLKSENTLQLENQHVPDENSFITTRESLPNNLVRYSNPLELPFSRNLPLKMKNSASTISPKYRPQRSPFQEISQNFDHSVSKVSTFEPVVKVSSNTIETFGTDRNNQEDTENQQQEEGVLEKMIHLEESYKEKVNILEEKLKASYKEVETKEKINVQLKQEISNLNKVLVENGKIVEISEQLSLKLSQMENVYEEDKKSFQNNLNALQEENQQLRQEKEDFEKKYENLLSVHQQMIEIDLQKNQNLLQSSFNKDQLRQSEQEISVLRNTINQSQDEIEYLRQNNHLMQKQYSYKITELKTQIAELKLQNDKLLFFRSNDRHHHHHQFS